MNLIKSIEKADTLRTVGNKHYSEKKFFDALVIYNESLCHAPNESESLGLVFANKSAVYFEMKLFDKSLKNIELAKAHKYPQKNFEILKKREEKCREMIKQQIKLSNPWEFFKISHKANKKLPFIAEGLELRTSEKYGKHIVANRQLKIGEILAIENPFCSVLLSESKFVEVDGKNKFQRCANCLRDCQLDLIPCRNCCEGEKHVFSLTSEICSQDSIKFFSFSAMFCSSSCQQKASHFHRYECPIMSSVLKSGSVNIALRIFFISLSAFSGSIEALQFFVNENDKSNSTVFDFDFSKPNCEENIKSYLKCLNSLSRSSKMFSLEAHLDILRNHTELNEMLKTHETFIRGFLQRQCQTNDLYFHGIFSGRLKKEETKDQLSTLRNLQTSIGSGWFPFCSLINHSCAPNVMRIYVEGKVVLVACRPIEKGAQLFDCYK
jgi:SET and MYND domain-containing protein 4